MRQLVLVDLPIREAVGAPRHARRGNNLVAIACVEDPAVVVLGLREPPIRAVGDVSITTELLDVHRVTQALHRLDFLGGFRTAKVESHVDMLIHPRRVLHVRNQGGPAPSRTGTS